MQSLIHILTFAASLTPLVALVLLYIFVLKPRQDNKVKLYYENKRMVDADDNFKRIHRTTGFTEPYAASYLEEMNAKYQ